jgi:hypothetical protein
VPQIDNVRIYRPGKVALRVPEESRKSPLECDKPRLASRPPAE